jgi:hypothetical protein
MVKARSIDSNPEFERIVSFGCQRIRWRIESIRGIFEGDDAEPGIGDGAVSLQKRVLIRGNRSDWLADRGDPLRMRSKGLIAIFQKTSFCEHNYLYKMKRPVV